MSIRGELPFAGFGEGFLRDQAEPTLMRQVKGERKSFRPFDVVLQRFNPSLRASWVAVGSLLGLAGAAEINDFLLHNAHPEILPIGFVVGALGGVAINHSQQNQLSPTEQMAETD